MPNYDSTKFNDVKFKNLKNDRHKYHDWFLTFPCWDKYGTDPSYCKKLIARLPPCDWAIACHEYHKNGKSHFHVSGWFTHKHNIRTWNDYFKKTFPDGCVTIDYRKTRDEVDYGRKYFLKENPPELVYETGALPTWVGKPPKSTETCSQEDWNRWCYSGNDEHTTRDDTILILTGDNEVYHSWVRYLREVKKRIQEQELLQG